MHAKIRPDEISLLLLFPYSFVNVLSVSSNWKVGSMRSQRLLPLTVPAYIIYLWVLLRELIRNLAIYINVLICMESIKIKEIYPNLYNINGLD